MVTLKLAVNNHHTSTYKRDVNCLWCNNTWNSPDKFWYSVGTLSLWQYRNKSMHILVYKYSSTQFIELLSLKLTPYPQHRTCFQGLLFFFCIVFNVNTLRTPTLSVHAGLFWCFHIPPNSKMAYRTFNNMYRWSFLYAYTWGASAYSLIWKTLAESAQNWTPEKSCGRLKRLACNSTHPCGYLNLALAFERVNTLALSYWLYTLPILPT